MNMDNGRTVEWSFFHTWIILPLYFIIKIYTHQKRNVSLLLLDFIISALKNVVCV